MSALRCTAKLLKATKAAPIPSPSAVPDASARLGDWTANLVRVGRIQLVLAVCEATRLGVVIDAAPYALSLPRLRQQVFRSLLTLGIEADDAATEVESIGQEGIAASNSRSVLATINRYVFDREAVLYSGRCNSARQLSNDLLGTVVIEPREIGSPGNATRRAFGLPPLRWQALRAAGHGVGM